MRHYGTDFDHPHYGPIIREFDHAEESSLLELTSSTAEEPAPGGPPVPPDLVCGSGFEAKHFYVAANTTSGLGRPDTPMSPQQLMAGCASVCRTNSAKAGKTCAAFAYITHGKEVAQCQQFSVAGLQELDEDLELRSLRF